jgi:6-phosphogluconolactonase
MELIYANNNFGSLVAQKIIYLAKKSIETSGSFSMAISGGNTPKPVFKEFYDNKKKYLIDWSKVNLFLTDERCVDKNSSDNNFKVCHDEWIQNYSEINSFRINGWGEHRDEALKYELKIKSILKKNGEFPQFDLIFMGFGEDGHIASLFPDYNFYKKTNNLVQYVKYKSYPLERITMNLNLLNNAKNRIFGVIGEKKKYILEKTFSSKKKYPLNHLLNSKSNDVWVLD